MTPIERELKNLNTIRLPDEARERMRAELSAYADLHAVSAQPTLVTAAPKGSPAVRLFQAFRFRMYASAAAVLAVVVGLGGTAYASADALPGDTLYAVKTNIAEPIQTALVPSTEGRAAWHAVLAERRLEEAAQLAAQNRLSSDTQENLAENFSTHVAASLHDAKLLEESGRTERSLAVRSDLEARLEAHEHILSVIATHYANIADSSSSQALATARSLNDLLDAVEGRESAVTAARLALENDIAPEHEPTVSTAVSISSEPANETVRVAIVQPPSAPDTAAAMHSDMRVEGFAPMAARVAPTAKVASESAAEVSAYDAARATEVKKIIDLHAELLSAFLPLASTTASSTEASTTEATSTPGTATSTDAGIETDLDAKAATDAANTLKETLQELLD